MVPSIFDYGESFLNPLLKILIFVVYGGVTISLFLSWRKHEGYFRQVSLLLLIGALAGFLSSLFRYLGDSLITWKWGESIFFLGFAIITLIVGYSISTLTLERLMRWSEE